MGRLGTPASLFRPAAHHPWLGCREGGLWVWARGFGFGWRGEGKRHGQSGETTGPRSSV